MGCRPGCMLLVEEEFGEIRDECSVGDYSALLTGGLSPVDCEDCSVVEGIDYVVDAVFLVEDVG